MLWYLQNKFFEPWGYYGDAFSVDECNAIIKYCETLKIEDAEIGLSESDISYRKNKISWLQPNNDTVWIYRRLTDCINHINQNIWNFDLENIAELQYTKYSNIGDNYKSHIDMHLIGATYRKLSFSLQLSDENNYSGCDLVIMDSEREKMTQRKQGTINFFPSFMLHKVTPLESGERNCLVGWVCGPNFR